MKAFFAELRRRNVVRVAILYAVVGWLVLQIADVVIPALGIPAWGVPLVIVLVALGFLIAVAMAWAFEITPEGIRRTHEVDRHESVSGRTGRKLDFLIIGVLAAALLYGVFDLFVLRERGVLAPQPRVPAAAASVVSIAVLPFVDMSRAKDQEYLADGISEELLNVLARVEGFKVTARTSAFAFKGRNEDLRTIGQKLGVENVLEGSVRTQGERIRVTAQLVKAADGYHLWSESYDRELGDVFAIQDDIARQVVDAIRSTLGSTGSAAPAARTSDPPPTRNVEAYTYFLRGQQFLRRRERAGMETALAEFERAVGLDPNFARAHVGIGTSLVLLASYGYKDTTDIEARAAAEFERALAIEPGLPDAYAGQGLLLDNRVPGTADAVPLFERAVAGNPSDSQALVWLANTYGIDARAEDERRTMERAYGVDPLAPVVLTNYAYMSQRLGQSDLAARRVGEMAALYPDSAALDRTRSFLAGNDGRFDEAIRWNSAGAKRHPDDAWICTALAFSWSFLGDAERSRARAARCRDVTPDSAVAVSTEVFVHLNVGDLDGAERLLEAADQRNDVDPYVHQVRAYYLLMRSDPAGALESLLLAFPVLRSPAPPMGQGSPFSFAPWAAYLFRETGDEAQARRVEQAFARAVETYWQPIKGAELAATLYERAQMAAAVGDQAALVELLSRYHARGGILPAYIPLEPWFHAYKNDPQVADLFAKADVQREDARRRLRSEGL